MTFRFKLRPLALLATFLAVASYADTGLAHGNADAQTDLNAQTSMSNPNAPAHNAGQALNQIHHINQTEISLAKLALKKTKDPQVTAFANRMIQDHTQADQQTLQLAKTENINLQRFKLTAEEKKTTSELKKLKGEKFDTAYMNLMKAGHAQAFQLLSSDQKNIDNTQVKSLISSLLPTVKDHEQMATTIASNFDQRRNQAVQAAGQAGGQTTGH